MGAAASNKIRRVLPVFEDGFSERVELGVQVLATSVIWMWPAMVASRAGAATAPGR